MDISLCMIVKNEENTLFQCLESVKNYVSEIIIVDTGSQDKTKEIAGYFTDKIYDFQWCNDFSKARNYSLEKATYPWVLVLDADEIVTDFHCVLTLDERKVGRIKRINIFEDNLGEKRYIEKVNRLFNKNFFMYEGIIHEQVVRKQGGDYGTFSVSISADHIGYTKEIINKSNKISRNLTLLMDSIKKNNNDPYLYYQLGKTYYMDKKYENAYIYFSKALTFELNTNYEYIEDLIETYGYTLINTGRYNDALVLKSYEPIYSKSLDFKFLMALIYMNNADFQNAVTTFSQCIGNNDGKIEGLNSYLSYYNIGVIYECLGYKKEALNYYKLCENYEPAIQRIKFIPKV